jgi:hypothetical protein
MKLLANVPKCPEGWLSFGDICYAFFGPGFNNSPEYTYDDARSFVCWQSGLEWGDLAWVDNVDQHNFIKGDCPSSDANSV